MRLALCCSRELRLRRRHGRVRAYKGDGHAQGTSDRREPTGCRRRYFGVLKVGPDGSEVVGTTK